MGPQRHYTPLHAITRHYTPLHAITRHYTPLSRQVWALDARLTRNWNALDTELERCDGNVGCRIFAQRYWLLMITSRTALSLRRRSARRAMTSRSRNQARRRS